MDADPNLNEFTPGQIDRAEKRLICVDRLRQARTRGTRSMSELVPSIVAQARMDFPGLQISRSSLYGWDRRYNGPADLVKLIDRRGGDRRSDDRLEWQSVADAAARLDRHPGHIRKLCDAWERVGQARRIVGGGRRGRWEIRRDAELVRAVATVSPVPTVQLIIDTCQGRILLDFPCRVTFIPPQPGASGGEAIETPSNGHRSTSEGR